MFWNRDAFKNDRFRFLIEFASEFQPRTWFVKRILNENALKWNLHGLYFWTRNRTNFGPLRESIDLKFSTAEWTDYLKLGYTMCQLPNLVCIPSVDMAWYFVVDSSMYSLYSYIYVYGVHSCAAYRFHYAPQTMKVRLFGSNATHVILEIRRVFGKLRTHYSYRQVKISEISQTSWKRSVISSLSRPYKFVQTKSLLNINYIKL